MTPRLTETQNLIADIDRLFSNKRLTRFLNQQASEPRQILEKIRDFLVRLAESDEQERLSQLQQSPLLAKFVGQENPESDIARSDFQQESGAFVVMEQQNNQFYALLAPLQVELQTLLQQRAVLVEEIRQLEQRRLHNYSLAQQIANQEQMISEFLQVLQNRFINSSAHQLPPTDANSREHDLHTETDTAVAEIKSYTPIQSISTEATSLESPQVERITRLAQELDQKLLALDGTVNVVFDALQRNIHTYHESLSQALARMHSQGVQGEQLLTGLINNLTQHLQQQPPIGESSIQNANEETSKPTIPQQGQPELKDTAIASSLDAVVFQLSPDTQEPLVTHTTTTGKLQPENSQFISDEVDQLYASLFASVATNEVTDDLVANTPVKSAKQLQPEAPNQVKKTNFIDELFMDVAPVSPKTPSFTTNSVQPKVVPEVTPEVKKATNFIDELFIDVAPTRTNTPDFTTNQEEKSGTFLHEVVFEAPNVAEDKVIDDLYVNDTSLPVRQTNQEQSDDSTGSIPDPWSAGSDISFLEHSHIDTQDIQELSYDTDTDLFVSNEGDFLVEEPMGADTITALTDLLRKIGEDEQLFEVSPDPRVGSTAVANWSANQSVVVIDNRDVDPSQDIYIPASPQENLLQKEENLTSEVADISLEEAQLQQLEQDLASFDGEINSLLQPLSNLENKEKTQNRLIPEEAPQPAVFGSTAETEKKNEITGEQLVGSLVSISNLINDPEVTVDFVNSSVWYLGIDLGTTGISAALLNRSTTEVYPLYWTAENQPEATSKTRSFRLPAEVYLPTASVNVGETESLTAQEQTTPAQEDTVEKTTTGEGASSGQTETTPHNLFSAQLKPYLQIALPYKNEQQKWEPVLQLNEFSTVPLVWVVRSLAKLLLTLMADRTSTTLGLTGAAVGIDREIFHSIISHVTGVICTCPSNWSEQYRFNIREAILSSKLVQHPQQVFFVEEAIACLLCELDGSNGEIVKIKGHQRSSSAKKDDRPLVGNTLVISIGANATEMALVDLPENLEDLTHSDFMLHGFPYAGRGVEQDIICQLLLPPKWRQPRSSNPDDSTTAIPHSDPWHWQPAIPGLGQMYFSSLKLEEFNLPRPGEPDVASRIHLQQKLESSVLGKAVIDAAIALKVILQHQESFTLELADQQWVLQRRDLESHVFVPFVRRLNRELNRLLVAKGIPTEAINQAILTGGVASLGAVSRWLRQKLPNARIIQDLYLGENGSPTCSRVAYGLAVLPLHPQVLEVPRQQYTDYFLFTELLRLLPTRSISFGEVIQLFENRGINTRSCQQRLLAFLEGELPPGFVPSTPEASWLTQSSSENSIYQAIAATPLFEKQGGLTYLPSAQQLQSIARYLDAIKASTQQSLDEPYTVNFALEVVRH